MATLFPLFEFQLQQWLGNFPQPQAGEGGFGAQEAGRGGSERGVWRRGQGYATKRAPARHQRGYAWGLVGCSTSPSGYFAQLRRANAYLLRRRLHAVPGEVVTFLRRLHGSTCRRRGHRLRLRPPRQIRFRPESPDPPPQGARVAAYHAQLRRKTPANARSRPAGGSRGLQKVSGTVMNPNEGRALFRNTGKVSGGGKLYKMVQYELKSVEVEIRTIEISSLLCGIHRGRLDNVMKDHISKLLPKKIPKNIFKKFENFRKIFSFFRFRKSEI